MEQSINNGIIPFKIQQLIDIIVKKKHFTKRDAFHYLYSSDLYRKLTSGDPFLWQQSTFSLYELLKKEKLLERKTQGNDPKITLFQSVCLEAYKNHYKISADESLYIFSKFDVFEYLKNVYETLHTQSQEYIIAEISQYIKNQKRK
jgi:hypothetical protein